MQFENRLTQYFKELERRQNAQKKVETHPGNMVREGYRMEKNKKSETYFLLITVSEEKLWEVFFGIVNRFREDISLILESKHDEARVKEFYRDGVEKAVIESYLANFADLFHQDPKTSIAVETQDQADEVRLDNNKSIKVFRDSQQFENDIAVLEDLGLSHMTNAHISKNDVSVAQSLMQKHRKRFYQLVEELDAEEVIGL